MGLTTCFVAAAAAADVKGAGGFGADDDEDGAVDGENLLEALFSSLAPLPIPPFPDLTNLNN